MRDYGGLSTNIINWALQVKFSNFATYVMATNRNVHMLNKRLRAQAPCLHSQRWQQGLNV